MPKPSPHTLSWSQEFRRYAWSTQGHLEREFSAEDTDAWQAQLATVTAFAFQGAAGHLNVYQEARRATGLYWYASQTSGKRTRKRYLGQLANVTFARLEAIAAALNPRVSEQASGSLESLAGMPLLATNLVPPILRSDLVVRERLLTRLDAALTHRLTLLAASAGWGKTTLLSMWATRSRFPVAWLSLSEQENDPTRFWIAVIAALRHSGACPPQVGERALELLRSPQPPPLQTILTILVNELSSQQKPLCLLLDDYQVIDEQGIHDALLFLLEHLPTSLHLVLASRTDPPLALARLRARGTLLEIRDSDLRFQEDEADQFLAQTMMLALAPAEVAELAQRTEGWIAGLHLAALALAHSQDHASFLQGFAGSHRYLMDYVQEEILAHIEPSLQDFVLRCAILNHLSAELCQAVTGQADAATCQQMLEQLERANLFLVPLDAERRWYRLHDLFRETLLARLHASQPEQVPLLHLHAASWYEAQGEWHEAIAHRCAAADYAGAARIMEQTAEQFWLQGEARTLARWIMAFPDEVICQRADFVLKVAYYLLNSYAHTVKNLFSPIRAQVEHLTLRVEKVALGTEGERQEHLCSHRCLLRQHIHLMRLMGDILEAGAGHDPKQFMLLIQQGLQVNQDDEIFWQMIPLANIFLYHCTLRGEGTLLAPRLLEMKRRVSLSGDSFALVKVKQWLAMASLQAGLLHQVYRESLEALALLEHHKGHAHLAGYFSLCLASVLLEWNRLDEARILLQENIADATAWQQVDRMMWGYTKLVELEIVAGNLQAANEVLQEEPFRLLGEEQGLHQFWRTRVQVQVQLWLAQAQIAKANAWAAQVIFHPVDGTPQQAVGAITLVRVFLANQQYGQALSLLETFRKYLDRPENIDTTSLFLSFFATTLYLAGEQERARAVVLRLLHLTRREGYLRVYLDRGEPMQQLLQSLLDPSLAQENGDAPIPHRYVSTLLKAFEQEEYRRAMRRETQPPARSREQAPGQHRLLESLTAQEQRVLHLLVEGRSIQEIAQALVVSRNTVKTHLRNLYSKLQVNSRAQAMVLARDLSQLFSPTHEPLAPLSHPEDHPAR